MLRQKSTYKLTLAEQECWLGACLTRAKKFLVRISVGFLTGVLLGAVQVGVTERTWPIVFEYGIVLAALAFAVTNYLEMRARLMAQVRAGANPAKTAQVR